NAVCGAALRAAGGVTIREIRAALDLQRFVSPGSRLLPAPAGGRRRHEQRKRPSISASSVTSADQRRELCLIVFAALSARERRQRAQLANYGTSAARSR